MRSSCVIGGLATFVEGGTVDPKNRLLHVGIDYTQYVTEDGTELKPKEYGVHEKDTFEGYEYVTTRTEANGDTVHVYKKIVTPTPTPEPENPTTPANPTPEPEVPVTPETPTQPVEETPAVPEQPADPVVPETPAEPTPEVPVTPVEPVENQTTNNTTEQKTETAKEQSSTTDIQSSKKIIETGARTNIFLSFSMAVAALFTGLFVLSKKKN